MRYLAALSLAAFAPFLLPNLQSAPANDNIQNAIELSAHELLNRTTGNVTGVTADGLTILLPGSQVPTAGYLFPAVWFKWTAPVKGTVSVQGIGRNFTIWGTTLIGPLGQDVYPVAGTDAISTGISLIASQMAYTYETQPGVTYFNALETSNINGANSYTYIHRFTQETLSDTFAGRTQMGGVDFTVFGNNSTYTVETGEPSHTAGSQSSSNRSVWTTWRSPNSRKAVSLEVQSKTFSPVIAVYTGDSLETLKRVTRSSGGTSAFASFIAEDGVDYHIAIDGADSKSGAFSLKLKADTVRPGFLTAPVATTVQQGETATFTATATYTGETVTYQWQRMPAGGKQWLSLADDTTYTGTQTAALSVVTTLDMNNDRYRVLATDVVGTSASRAALLTVTEFAPVLTEILGTVGGDATGTINISRGEIPEPTNGGVYYATGLPKGLSINPETGEITGVIDAKAGTYRVVYGSTDGKKKNPETYVIQIIVSPLSTHLGGAFEALLDTPDARNTPEGKISFKVAANGRFTGTFFDLADGKSYPFSSSLVLNQESRTATNPSDTPVRISRGTRPPLYLEISMAEPAIVDEEAVGSTVVSAVLFDSGDTILAQSDDGAPVSRFTAANPAPWAGRYTLRLVNDSFIPRASDSESPSPPTPIGSGHATGTIADKTGVLSLKGLLSDNTPFTASVASSPGATYRLCQRVYGPGGKLAGRINLVEKTTSDAVTLAYYSDEFADSIVHWTKPVRAKDKLYAAGFDGGIVSTRILMAPWINPAGQIASALGLAAAGDMKVEIQAAVLQDGNGTNAYGLPVDVQLSPGGAISFVDPSINNTKFKLTITPLTGAFSGSYELAEPAPSTAKPRKVTFSGVLFRNSVVFQGDVIGEGFAIVPPLQAEEKTTAASIKFLAGPPQSPFNIPTR